MGSDAPPATLRPASGRPPPARWMGPAVRAVVGHPGLWPTGIAQAWRLRRHGWWRSWPFLPLPDPDYLALRSLTAYGDPHEPPAADDVVTYLRWCQAWPGRGRRLRTRRADRVR